MNTFTSRRSNVNFLSLRQAANQQIAIWNHLRYCTCDLIHTYVFRILNCSPSKCNSNPTWTVRRQIEHMEFNWYMNGKLCVSSVLYFVVFDIISMTIAMLKMSNITTLRTIKWTNSAKKCEFHLENNLFREFHRIFVDSSIFLFVWQLEYWTSNNGWFGRALSWFVNYHPWWRNLRTLENVIGLLKMHIFLSRR